MLVPSIKKSIPRIHICTFLHGLSALKLTPVKKISHGSRGNLEVLIRSLLTPLICLSLSHTYMKTLCRLFFTVRMSLFLHTHTHTSTISLTLYVIISLSRLKFESVVSVFNDHTFWVVHSLEMTLMLILSIIIDSTNVFSIYYPISI